MRKFLLTLIIVALVVSVCLNIGMCRHLQTEVVKSDTVYKEITAEVRDSAPVVQEDKTIGQISIPVHTNSPHIGKNHVKETGKSLHDTANIAKKDENLNMTLDIVQRKYTDDSTYTAYVSGLKYGIYPRLDSITTKHRIIERTITNYLYHDRKGLKVKLRPAVGGGYDLLNRQWGVYVGGALVFDW